MVLIFDGKKQAEVLFEKLKKKVSKLAVKPSLCIVRTGNNPSQLKFTSIKERMAKRLGIKCNIIEYPHDCTTNQLVSLIKKIPSKYTGILVQLPLPKQINREVVLDSIPYHKDVEGLSSKRFNEINYSIPDIYSPVAKAIVSTLFNYLENERIDINKQKISIIGNSYLIGQPVYNILKQVNKNISHVKRLESDLQHLLRDSDIIISGVGIPNLIDKEYLSENSICIDGGFEIDEDGNISGDFNSNVRCKCRFFTPVPGGIGPLTIVYIYDNLLKL